MRVYGAAMAADDVLDLDLIDALLDPDPSDARRFRFGNVRVLRVVDGDTIDVLVIWSVGFKMGMFTEQRLRLLGVDTPETNRRAERAAGLAAKARVEELLPVGSRVSIETHKSDVFGRYLAEVYAGGGAVVTAEWVGGPPPGVALGRQLVDEGHGEEWKRGG